MWLSETEGYAWRPEEPGEKVEEDQETQAFMRSVMPLNEWVWARNILEGAKNRGISERRIRRGRKKLAVKIQQAKDPQTKRVQGVQWMRRA
jgi:hypothetical protein